MPADPKPPARVVDREALRAAVIVAGGCAACGRPPGGMHHVVPRGAPYHGDDVADNLLPLCGSGTTGCHGKVHAGDLETRELVGFAIAARPRMLAYVTAKLGPDAGSDYLRRRYLIDL